MPEPFQQQGEHRILALLWHAPQPVITAGGFRRTFEIFKRAPSNVAICAIDDNPSFLRSIGGDNVRVLEYKIPKFIRGLQDRYFWFERAAEWKLSTVLMVLDCAGLRLKGESFNTVFVPSSEQIPALLAGIVAKYLFGARLAACNTNLDIFPSAVRKPLARLHNAADVVIAISEHLSAQLVSYGVHSRIVVNGVGLDTGAIARVHAPAEKEYDAVFVGRHDPEKGIFDLIEIWRSVVNQLPTGRLLMIGSCNPQNRRKLAALISRYALEDNVVMMGTVDDHTKFSLMKSSKLCLFPSHVEEWGIVPQEALACGLPVVTYDLPVFKENIKPCPAVFCEAVGDLEGVAHRAVELLTAERFRDYERIGPEFVGKFDWDEVARREYRALFGSTTIA
jgi:glycosyltransferase involved in cell wall biosynthesis